MSARINLYSNGSAGYRYLYNQDASATRYLAGLLANKGSLHPETRLAVERVDDELGPQFRDLILHPGLLWRLDDLINFAREHPELDPYALPKKFNRSLAPSYAKHGYRVVSRAVAIKKEQKNRIMKEGMLSAYARLGFSYTSSVKRVLVEGLSSLMQRHVSMDLEESPLISTAADSDLACAVCEGYLTKETNIHCFEIRVPFTALIGDSWSKERLGFYSVHPSQIARSYKTERSLSPYRGGDPY